MHGFYAVGTDPNNWGKATEARPGDPSVLRSGWRRVGSAEARISPAGGHAVYQLLLPGLPTCYQPESSEARYRVVISSSPQEWSTSVILPPAQHCSNDFAKPFRMDGLAEAHEDPAASRILFAETPERAVQQLFHSPILTLKG